MLLNFDSIKWLFMQGAKPLLRCLSPSPWRQPAPNCSGGRGRPPSLCTFHLASEVPPLSFWGATWLAPTDSGEAGSRRLRFPPLVKVRWPFQTLLQQQNKGFMFESRGAAPQLTMRSVWASRSLANDSRSTTVTPLFTWRRARGQRGETRGRLGQKNKYRENSSMWAENAIL